MIIEIADATLSHDRNRKARIYAQAGIPEYWVVNLKQRQVIVYRQPQGEAYQSEQILEATDAITPLAFPAVRIELQTILL